MTDSSRPDKADSGTPKHLHPDAPFQVCVGCERRTWTASKFGQPCGFPQPNGSRCAGTFSTLSRFPPVPEGRGPLHDGCKNSWDGELATYKDDDGVARCRTCYDPVPRKGGDDDR